MRPDAGKKQDVHQHSGWLIPLGFALAILVLCALILGWYLRPGIGGNAAPTSESRIVHLRIQDLRLAIPANYIATPAARAGGSRNSVTLVALYPSFRGYGAADARLFAGNAPDSPVIHITLRGGASLSLRERLERVYRPYLRAEAGVPDAYGLTRHAFAQGSGYDGNELFAGNGAGGLELFLCNKPGLAVASPNCMALERPLDGKAGLSWRFKRAQLAHWRAIADGVQALVRRFEAAD